MTQFLNTLTGNLVGLFMTVSLVIIAIELTLRILLISRIEPGIKHCPPRQIPRVIWNVLTRDQILLFAMLKSLVHRHHRRDPVP